MPLTIEIKDSPCFKMTKLPPSFVNLKRNMRLIATIFVILQTNFVTALYVIILTFKRKSGIYNSSC